MKRLRKILSYLIALTLLLGISMSSELAVKAADSSSVGVYFDPSTVTPSIYKNNLTENNLRFTMTSSSPDMGTSIHTNTSINSKKWYWEVELINYPPIYQGVGLANIGVFGKNGSYIFSVGNWITINENSKVNSYTYGTAFKSGDVVSVLLDADNGKIEYLLNGVSQGTKSFDINAFGKDFHPYLGVGFPNTDFRANFGATTFKYADKIPSGYLPYSLSEPIKLTATSNPTNSQVNLNWNSIGGAIGYNVYRLEKSGGPYTLLTESPISATSYTDSKNGTGYYIVRAVANGTEGPDSNEASVTPIYTGNKAILEIVMTNGTIKEYDLYMDEIDKFLTWYDNRSEGIGKSYYRIIKRSNVKPFNSRYEYLQFDKIYSFEVKDYNDK